MAFYEGLVNRTYISGAAISQFRFVVGPNASGQVTLAGASARVTGVALAAATAAGQAIPVAVDGRVTVVAAASIAVGALIASDATGQAITAVATNIAIGVALEAAVAGQVFTMELRNAYVV